MISVDVKYPWTESNEKGTWKYRKTKYVLWGTWLPARGDRDPAGYRVAFPGLRGGGTGPHVREYTPPSGSSRAAFSSGFYSVTFTGDCLN